MSRTAMLFENRETAGRLLGDALRRRYEKGSGILFAIPRGGVVVGFYAARAIQVPLDVVIPKKIGAPSNPEFALGAVMEDGAVFMNPAAAKSGFSQEQMKTAADKIITDIRSKMTLYRGSSPMPDVGGKTVFIADDGIATGSTVFAAVHYFRKLRAEKIIISVPVAPVDTMKRLQRAADDVVCLHCPDAFFSVGQFYADFHQISDEEVMRYLRNDTMGSFGTQG